MAEQRHVQIAEHIINSGLIAKYILPITEELDKVGLQHTHEELARGIAMALAITQGHHDEILRRLSDPLERAKVIDMVDEFLRAGKGS